MSSGANGATYTPSPCQGNTVEHNKLVVCAFASTQNKRANHLCVYTDYEED